MTLIDIIREATTDSISEFIKKNVLVMEKLFTIKRVSRHDGGIYGVMLHNTVAFAVTLENEDYAIPAGFYQMRTRQYYRGGYPTYKIMDVAGRTNILIHKGNIRAHSKGCILIGEQFDPILGEDGITHSGKAFEEFMLRAGGEDRLALKVIEC